MISGVSSYSSMSFTNMRSTNNGNCAQGTQDISAFKEKIFTETDSNGDGSIDKAELTAAMQNRPPPGETSETPNIDDIFTQMDTDGDGLISREESDAAIDKRQEEMANEVASLLTQLANSLSDMKDKMFSDADSNSDGSIDITELEAVMKNRPAPPNDAASKTQNIDELFTQMDTDGDGLISKTESDTAIDKREAARANELGASASANVESGSESDASTSTDYLALITQLLEKYVSNSATNISNQASGSLVNVNA